ncbi:outer membrane protein assembly factor BamC [Nitrincola tapanii]|uniref:Outer membrane protein assembly factor BamC n=1 Tax=Nitrincola tapanii TaxID=1708751 RepID=A0A5A9W4W9_9GAMM|nr:outer membrane protein assembly factor BamC [Nitrincola tapanii]KAA0875129.1 outer membrane protein assembly factor BamC [Nitrincola tapanii]
MIKYGISACIVTGLALGLIGCNPIKKNPVYGEHGLIRDRSQDYELAEGASRLQVPEHLRAREMREQLVVPDVGVTATRSGERFRVPRPEFFYADPGSETVSLSRLEGQRIIVVDEPIADVWLKMLDFWEYNGVRIARTDPRLGTMESEWIRTDGRDYSFIDRWIKRLTLQGIEGPADNKIRVSVRPDPADYSRTAISLKHAQFPAGQGPEAIDWDGSIADVGFKTDMMFEMLRYLSRATAPSSAQSLLAMEQQRRSQPQLGRDSRGNPALRISADADTAWHLIDAALTSANLDVGTRDQASGTFYMTYTTTTPFDDTKKMGFFEWLHSDRGEIKLDTRIISSALGFDGKETSEVISYTSKGARTTAELLEDDDMAVDLNDPNNLANQEGYKIWFAGRVIYVFGSGRRGIFNTASGEFEHVGRYQVQLSRTRSGVVVTVLTDEGVAAPAIVAEEILWDIREYLPAQI